jgi:hypothetical protein
VGGERRLVAQVDHLDGAGAALAVLALVVERDAVLLCQAEDVVWRSPATA